MQMMISNNGAVSDIQSVVADSGDWVFNAKSRLHWTKSETFDPIPEPKRDTRATIKTAGDAYFDSWKDGTCKAPYGPSPSPFALPASSLLTFSEFTAPGIPCARLEGGSYTSGRNPISNSCFMPVFPQPFIDAGGAKNRRYFVDEKMGAVGVLNDSPFKDTGGPIGTPSCNFLRVEGGRIWYVHESMICKERGRGR